MGQQLVQQLLDDVFLRIVGSHLNRLRRNCPAEADRVGQFPLPSVRGFVHRIAVVEQLGGSAAVEVQQVREA